MNNMVNEQDEPDIIGDEEYPQPKEVDEDEVYERWRDEGSEDLDEALKALIKSFIERKNHYYSGHLERTLEHAISSLTFELEQEKKASK